MPSIFSTYSQGENRVTSTLIHTLRCLPINLVERFLEMMIDDETKGFFHFKNQVNGENSKPDAEISANFKIIIETKTEKGGINEKQKKNTSKLSKKATTQNFYTSPQTTKGQKTYLMKQYTGKIFITLMR